MVLHLRCLIHGITQMRFYSLVLLLRCECGGLYVCGGVFDLQIRCTVLTWAAAMGRADCVQLLIDAGSDKEVKDVVRWFPALLCMSASLALLCVSSTVLLYFSFASCCSMLSHFKEYDPSHVSSSFCFSLACYIYILLSSYNSDFSFHRYFFFFFETLFSLYFCLR